MTGGRVRPWGPSRRVRRPAEQAGDAIAEGPHGRRHTDCAVLVEGRVAPVPRPAVSVPHRYGVHHQRDLGWAMRAVRASDGATLGVDLVGKA